MVLPKITCSWRSKLVSSESAPEISATCTLDAAVVASPLIFPYMILLFSAFFAASMRRLGASVPPFFSLPS